MKSRVALVSAREALAVDEDMSPLRAALLAAGAEVEAACWDDPSIDWSCYDAAVLRSTWDYVDRLDEFHAWAARCAAQTRLLNPPEVIRWNTDKRYLRDLHTAGVAVVPTRFVAPGAAAATELDGFLAGGPAALSVGSTEPFEEYVVKPSVGAGSRDAARYRRGDESAAVAHLARLLEAGRVAMLQPYLGRVDAQGETAVVYLGGRYSHAFRKGPLLRRGDGLVEGLFAVEDIAPRTPSDTELAVAAAAYAAIPARPPVYARIDLVRDAFDAPVVLELELTEPSLYFRCAEGAAERYARILLETLRS